MFQVEIIVEENGCDRKKYPRKNKGSIVSEFIADAYNAIFFICIMLVYLGERINAANKKTCHTHTNDVIERKKVKKRKRSYC